MKKIKNVELERVKMQIDAIQDYIEMLDRLPRPLKDKLVVSLDDVYVDIVMHSEVVSYE